MKVGKILVGGITLTAMLVGLAFAGPAVGPSDEGTVFSEATLMITPGQEAAFETVTKTVSVASRNEPGNLEYRVHRSVADPHVYTAYEVFRTAEYSKIDVREYTMLK